MIRLSLILMILLLAGSSCKKIDKYTNFYIDVSDHFYANPVDAEDNIIDVWLFKTHDNIHDLFTQYNTDVGSTEKIAFSSITLKITENGIFYYNDIESVELYLNANDLNPEKIGWSYDINKQNDTIIDMDFSDSDIKEYIISNYNVLNIKIKVINNFDVETRFDLQYKLYISSELDET